MDSSSNSNSTFQRSWDSMDYSVSKTVLNEGDKNSDFPLFGSTGTIILTKLEITESSSKETLSNPPFPSFSSYFNNYQEGNSVDFKIGKTGESEVDRTLEKLVKSMFIGEISEAVLRVNISNEKNTKKSRSNPPSSSSNGDSSVKDSYYTILFNIELKSLVNAPPLHEWYPESKFDLAEECTLSGAKLFKEGRFLDAFYQYQTALNLVSFVIDIDKPESGDLSQKATGIKWTCVGNITACHFQWGNYKHVIDLASEGLKEKPDNLKLRYRRGVAYLERNDFDEAKQDLGAAARLDPDNKAVHEKLGLLKIKINRHNEMMKKMFKNM